MYIYTRIYVLHMYLYCMYVLDINTHVLCVYCYESTCIYIYICMRASLCVCVCVHTHAHSHVCLGICEHMSIDVGFSATCARASLICTYMNTYKINISLYIHIHMYIPINMYTHTCMRMCAYLYV